MAHIHFFLQGKGGVGKTTCAFYYAQNLVDSGNKIVIFDCDPVNWSLSTFTSIPVQKFDLKSNDGARLDTAKLPKIFNKIDQICQKACAENLLACKRGRTEDAERRNADPVPSEKRKSHDKERDRSDPLGNPQKKDGFLSISVYR